MNEVSYVIIGWFIGILTMLINKWLDSFKERKRNENKILSECLIFIFAARDMYNEIAICLASLHEMGEKYPEKRNQLEKDLYIEAEAVKEKQFFPKLMLQSFQLQTLQDKTFFPLFEKIMLEYKKLHESIVSHKTMDEIDTINKNILNKGVETRHLTYTYSLTYTVNSVFSPLFFVTGNERAMLIRWFYGFYDPLRVNPESLLMA